ncbi:hypothetical protein F5Y12DRAFT_727371 [Xylaria sp. FL1777]|nr:hypothetical protein F5Y12DRAFT_727371 [Xylaria sp. FL1777]
MQAIGITDFKKLAGHSTVGTLLSTTKEIHRRTASELYDAIQIYVDSKKPSSTPFGEETNGGWRMELWPLVKVVRIYTKADVLSTGAVIVDLPGVQDSNAAREAVAGKYIEKCNGLWVVSMITRAVDYQAAQELLGTRFKQQLQLDGNYSNVTFVCSKTDDINFDEAADGLGLNETFQKLDKVKHSLSTLKTSLELEKFKERKNAISVYAEEVDKHIDRYEELRYDQAKGETVTPPKEYPRNHKIGVVTTRSSKRLRANMDQGPQDTQWISTEDRWGDLEKDMPKFPAECHLTSEDIQSMIKYLRSQKRSAIDEKKKLQEKIDNGEIRLVCLEEEVSELEEELKVACVSQRNNLSRQTIRAQFALGLKELDEYEAERIDPNSFDPEKSLRDYAEVGRSLPIFCVSSKAYQSLAKCKQVDGFCNMDATEIPQLRAHAKKLTEATRIRDMKSFLNDLAQTFNSLYLWSSKKGPEFYLTDEERKAEMKYVKEQVNQLEKRLQLANDDFSRQLNKILEALFQFSKTAILHAAKCAPDTARGWPSRKRGDKGLSCTSYRAILRRNGAFSGRNGPRNFNEDLAALLLQQLSKPWEATFTEKIPEALKVHATTCQGHQEYIHGLIKSRLQNRVASNGIIGMLQNQDKIRVTRLTDKITAFTSDVEKWQREANREFASAIQRRLKSKYEELTKDKGRGVFVRIKSGMETEIAKHMRSIFTHSCKSAQAKLSHLLGSIQRDLEDHIGIMREDMISDYVNVILGADNSEESKVVRQKVYELLKEVDGRFQ